MHEPDFEVSRVSIIWLPVGNTFYNDSLVKYVIQSSMQNTDLMTRIYSQIQYFIMSNICYI